MAQAAKAITIADNPPQIVVDMKGAPRPPADFRKAYFDLEGDLCDLVIHSRIALSVAHDTVGELTFQGGRSIESLSEDDVSRVLFIAAQQRRMLEELQAKYLAAFAR